MKTIEELEEENKKLRATVEELKAHDIYNMHVALKDIEKTGVDRYVGSGLILEIKNLSGKKVVGPVMIVDGLNVESISALKNDILRSMQMRLSYIGIDYKKEN